MVDIDIASAPARPFDNPGRGRFNAWFFSAFDRYINTITAPLKRAAFGSIVGGTVVEIGPGVGANLRHLPPGTRLIAIEPNARMHAALARRCARAGVDLEIVSAYADRMPLPDASVDDVICSLVLCTVPDPDAVLREVVRVLRPGGRFRFVEHVAAPPESLRSRVQLAVRAPWGWLFEGCDPHRDTAAAIERAGFEWTALIERRLRRSVFYPVNIAICGVARR